MKVVVTGAAGMIGSNLIQGLNAIGVDDIIAVDNLTDGPKYRNLLGARVTMFTAPSVEFLPSSVPCGPRSTSMRSRST